MGRRSPARDSEGAVSDPRTPGDQLTGLEELSEVVDSSVTHFTLLSKDAY